MEGPQENTMQVNLSKLLLFYFIFNSKKLLRTTHTKRSRHHHIDEKERLIIISNVNFFVCAFDSFGFMQYMFIFTSRLSSQFCSVPPASAKSSFTSSCNALDLLRMTSVKSWDVYNSTQRCETAKQMFLHLSGFYNQKL